MPGCRERSWPVPDASAGDVAGEADAGDQADDGHEDPKGTMVLMLLFLALIIAMWIWAYYSMIVRG